MQIVGIPNGITSASMFSYVLLSQLSLSIVVVNLPFMFSSRAQNPCQDFPDAIVQLHTIDQAATQRVAALLAESLRQRGTFRIRKDACRKRLKHWATVFFFIPSFTVNSVPSSAIGAEKNSLQGKIVDMSLKHSR